MFAWEAALCFAYTVSATLIGVFLLSQLGMPWNGQQKVTFPAWIMSAFLLGQGLLANVWILLALEGYLNVWTVVGVLLASACVGCPEALCLRTPIAERLKSVLVEFQQETWAWRMVACGGVALALFFIPHALFLPIDPDSAAFYMALPKLIAYTHQLTLLPSYHNYSTIGLQGEMHWASLMILGTNSQARLFAWPTALAGTAMLLSLAATAGIGRRGQWVLVTMVFTSFTFTDYIWGGKVDLFGAAMGTACLYWACQTSSPARRLALGLTGLFFGLAVVAKISLIVVLSPAVALLLVWNAFVLPARFSWPAAVRFAVDSLVVGTCGLLVFLPHAWKNFLLFQEPLAPFYVFGGLEPLVENGWYSAEATRYIVATYPLVLTYGQYSLMGGTLSCLALIFLPLAFFLPRPQKWTQSRLTVLTCAALAGLVCWLILRPGILSPRYILPILLVLFLLPAKAVEYLSWTEGVRSGLRAACLVCLFVVQITTIRQSMFGHDLKGHIKQALRNNSADPRAPMCLACKAVNEAAAPGDTVLIVTHYRYWLREDLLRNIEGRDFGKHLAKMERPEERWAFIAGQGFHYLILDGHTFPDFIQWLAIDKGNGSVAATPEGIDIQTIYYHRDNYAVFRVKTSAAVSD